jgi:hypothetical protein
MSSKEYKCCFCNKFYKSYKSFWNHKNHFHKNVLDNVVTNIVTDVTTNVTENKKSVTCKFCNKIFNHRSNKCNHEKICKLKINIHIKNETDDKIQKLENAIFELKELILKTAKIHPKTLQKINKQLINTNININTNNTNIINNTYVKFGSVAHSSVLSETKILGILSKPYKSIEESIKLIHFNKNLPEYNNIAITNMKDNIAYTYNGNKFICVNKDELIDELIDIHKDQIEISYESYKNKLRDFTQKRLEAFLNDINNESEIYKDKFNKFHVHFKAYKMHDIKMLIYNLSDYKKLEILKNINLKEKIII